MPNKTGPKRVPLKERLLKRVTVNEATGCWNWTGATIKSGSPTSKKLHYGVIGEGGARESGARVLLVHRASWLVHFGEIPEGKQILHRCDNTRCVNPEHLFIGTASENMKDCFWKGRMPQAWPTVITERKIESIRDMSSRGEEAIFIARKAGVSWQTVQRVLNGTLVSVPPSRVVVDASLN